MSSVAAGTFTRLVFTRLVFTRLVFTRLVFTRLVFTRLVFRLSRVYQCCALGTRLKADLRIMSSC